MRCVLGPRSLECHASANETGTRIRGTARRTGRHATTVWAVRWAGWAVPQSGLASGIPGQACTAAQLPDGFILRAGGRWVSAIPPSGTRTRTMR